MDSGDRSQRNSGQKRKQPIVYPVPVPKYSLEFLFPGSYEEFAVRCLFKGPMQNRSLYRVFGMYRIHNQTLTNMYELRKRELSRIGLVTERYLFHGTLDSNLHSICAYNFNPRLAHCNDFLGPARLALGVYFTPKPDYACIFPIFNTDDPPRTVVVARVLELNCELTCSDDVIKFRDHEYLPVYVIKYIPMQPDLDLILRFLRF